MPANRFTALAATLALFTLAACVTNGSANSLQPTIQPPQQQMVQKPVIRNPNIPRCDNPHVVATYKRARRDGLLGVYGRIEVRDFQILKELPPTSEQGVVCLVHVRTDIDEQFTSMGSPSNGETETFVLGFENDGKLYLIPISPIGVQGGEFFVDMSKPVHNSNREGGADIKPHVAHLD